MSFTRPWRWALIGVTSLALAAGLLWQMPLKQALRSLPAISGGALHILSAQGPWHDSRFSLGCATPNGRMLDCGRYAAQTSVDLEKGHLIRITAQQSGGGSLVARLGWRGGRAELSGVRLPIAVLAIGLPIVEQMQFGGEVTADGVIDGPEAFSLDLRWQSEFGEFATGLQQVRIRGSKGRAELQFLPPDQTNRQSMSLDGKVTCEFTPGKSGGRCRGEVDVMTDQSVLKLDSLLAAMAPRVAPGHYRLKVDAR